MKPSSRIVLFVAAMCFVAMAGGIFETTYNNYLVDTFQITAEQRGDLELPREFPGLMVAVLAAALFFVGEVNLAVGAAVLIGFGMFFLGNFAGQNPHYARMVAFTVVWSTGAHLMMPVGASLALAFSKQEREGEKLGKLASVTALATVVGCGLVALNFKVLPGTYRSGFVIGSCVAFLGAFCFLGLKRVMAPIHHGPRPKWVLRRRYWLFYLLSILFGARKQLFISFAPLLLIRVFDRGATTFAVLWMVSKALAVLIMPRIGRLIDRFGERAILMADAAVLLVVCLAYGFAKDVLPSQVALAVVCGAYIVDQLLFHVQIARSTYLSKIAVSRKDVTASLGLGVSINHGVSIPIAMLGGRLWMAFSYHYVFVAAACIALLILAASNLVRIPEDRPSVTDVQA